MLFARFFKDRKGGIAPMLALGPLRASSDGGASVGYRRATLVRTAMQNALDAPA